MAGHSQGGFTSLWIGGARVNPDLFLAYQTFWRNNPVVPANLRAELPLDAGPTRDVHDGRVKAAFSMAPGTSQASAWTKPGSGSSRSRPTSSSVPETPRLRQKITRSLRPSMCRTRLDILPGLVNHEIFVNECDALGRDTWPEACIDAPGVDRGKLHQYIGKAALKFFDETPGCSAQLQIEGVRRSAS